MNQKQRCAWPKNPLAIAYHDEEWGVPVHDDRKLFECLTLEGAQAGLSWDTILAKRQNYRRAFERFDMKKVAGYGARERRRLLADAGIVRHSRKIDATIENARRVLEVRKEFGSFSKYVWSFAGRGAEALSKDLRRRGFRFVGPTTVYAFMQAVGMVNDHEEACFRRHEVGK
ncbi:MAG TPA: DNA-3-methyladenine glycosylase I [Burkholderiales bacterium]|jgi:DNA-3-methyladenine glycosylase I